MALASGDDDALRDLEGEFLKKLSDWESVRNSFDSQVKRLKQAIDEFEKDPSLVSVTINGEKFTRARLDDYRRRFREMKAYLQAAWKVVGKKGDDRRKLPIYQLRARLQNYQNRKKAIGEARAELVRLEKERRELEKSLKKGIYADKRQLGPKIPEVDLGYGRRCEAITAECRPWNDVDWKDWRQRDLIGRKVSPPIQGLYSVPLLAGQFRQLDLPAIGERLDPDALVKAAFGDAYEVADWNDVKAAYLADPGRFTREWRRGYGSAFPPKVPYEPSVPGATHYRGGANVYWNGKRSARRINYGGRNFERLYFFQYHNGAPHPGFLVHDEVGGKQFSLGSWQSAKPYLAKKVKSGADFAFDRSAGPRTKEIWRADLIDWGADQPGATPTFDNLDITVDPRSGKINVWGLARVYASYYAGKNYLGVAYTVGGDESKSNDPSVRFGWGVTTPSTDLGDYDYMTWGKWQEDVAYDPNTGAITFTRPAHWIAGQLTDPARIPDQGRAVFTGRAEGIVDDGSKVSAVAGDVRLTADFARRTLHGQFSNMRHKDGRKWRDLSVQASWTGNKIAGSIAGAGGTSGAVSGHFYGPNAREIGGLWKTTRGPEKAAGIFRARRP